MTNHLGHVYGVFDQTGTRVESHAYSPYGAISGDDLSVQPFGMSTKRSDFASGLVYFGYRFYVPHLGRWLNRDPLQEQGGINLYGYVHDDPLGYVDPDGRFAIWVARGVAAAVGAGSDYLIQAGFYYAAHGSWIPWDCVDGYSMLESAGLGALGVGKSAKVTRGTTNLASPQRTKHILTGDSSGGGHKFGFSRLFNGKAKFPASWSSDKIMNAVSDIATDPSLKWAQQTGNAGNWFTKAGKPARFIVEGTRNGTNIKVVLEPTGEGIITAFPIK